MLNGFMLVFRKQKHILSVTFINKESSVDSADCLNVIKPELVIKYTFDISSPYEQHFDVDDRSALKDVLDLDLADKYKFANYLKKYGLFNKAHLDYLNLAHNTNQSFSFTTAEISYISLATHVLRIKSLSKLGEAIQSRNPSQIYIQTLIFIAYESRNVNLFMSPEYQTGLMDVKTMFPQEIHKNICALIASEQGLSIEYLVESIEQMLEKMKFIKSLNYQQQQELRQACERLFKSVLNFETKKLGIQIESQNGKYNTLFVTDDLMCLLCYQIATLVSGDVVIKKCSSINCPNHFEVSINDNRKKYCSARCAQLEAKRAERRRKKEGVKNGQH